ncbi:MAG: zinc ribbon domain-containing protein [Armatimonadetes bacterium]|nr:zinc ribbon domain-containing protein [Armatimonadota bacterium]
MSVRLQRCPRCQERVQPTDTHCMSCGLDLLEAVQKLTASAAQSAPTQRPAVAITNPAAAGIATDVGQDTRIREFDEQLAEQLRAGRSASIVGGILGLLIGLAMLLMGLGIASKSGGVGEALRALGPAYLRGAGLAGLLASPFLAAVCIGVGLAGLLVCVGQLHWAYTAHQAIEDVKLGGRPTVVGISAFTIAGMLIASFLFPPLGFVLGFIFLFSKDPDTHDLGKRMILVAFAAVAYILLNFLWGLAANLRAPAATGPSPAEAVPEG